MNHEILFQGKRIDNGEWVEGFYVHYDDVLDRGKDDCDFIVQRHTGKHFPFVKVEPGSVGLYAGKVDKNGRKIFAGHLCLCVRNIAPSVDRAIFEIRRGDHGFYGDSPINGEISVDEFELCEIVGHICGL